LAKANIEYEIQADETVFCDGAKNYSIDSIHRIVE
jgi:hypothetical protein